jgi:uncharacterized damage-inducible protein DinB
MDIQQAKADLREHYARVRAELLAAIEGLSEAQLTEESLDGWSVRDHLVHVAVWDEVRSLEIARISDGLVHAWSASMTPAEVDEFNDLTVRLRKRWSGQETVAQLQWARHRVLEAIEAATERAFDESLYGESGLRSEHDLEHAEHIRAWRQRKGY